MTETGTLLIEAIIFAAMVQRFAKRNSLADLEKYARTVLIAAACLFAADKISGAPGIFRVLWHAGLFGMLWYCYKNQKIEGMRVFVVAFAPVIIANAAIDLLHAVRSLFNASFSLKYIDWAGPLSFMWMLAILFNNNRQAKIMEKERIERKKTEDLNRAIAIRKVELEDMVAERTKELQAQTEELKHALDELRTTQAQLIQAEKMASLGELTAGIAHEIQNPLNFVNNFSEVSNELIDEMNIELEKGDIEEAKAIAADVKQNLEKITHHGKRADSIVKGMLQHSRKSTGQKEPVDINALADEYMRLSYHGLRAKDKSFNATMHTSFDDTIGKVNVIPQDIGRVLLNLFNNSFYAVTEKAKENPGSGFKPTISLSTIRYTMANGDGRAVITVADNGDGIPQAIIDKIFQPFFTTKPTGQGTGLGLSLSYDIVKAHGGDIKVETKPGEGTSFIISLPLQ